MLSMKERTERYIKFFDEANWPTMLKATLKWQEEMERRYQAAGSPLGEGMALEWCQQEYLTWSYKRDVEEPTVQDELLKEKMDMAAMGDGVMRNGEYVLGPKSVARRVALATNRIVTLADDEGRGLTDLELWELRYTLAVASSELQTMLKERAS